MPQFPQDWLGWLTLLGSVAGLFAAGKLFIANLWFNAFQRRVLISVAQSSIKDIFIIRRWGGGIVFAVNSKLNDEPNDFYEYFSDGGGKNGDSYANLIYLHELSKRGYFVQNIEIKKVGSSEMKEENYTMTAKGLRTARIFTFFHQLSSKLIIKIK